MNTPNKLTLLRVILIPIFMVFYLLGHTWSTAVALLVFIAASVTDHFDGYLARKNGQVTTFGKLMDPLADKLLVLSALICFLQRDIKFINAALVVIILARELIVTGFRMLALGENKVIAASMWGKAKTVSQMTLVIGVMVFEIFVSFVPGALAICDIITLVFAIMAAILSIYSGFDYIWKNKDILTFK